LGPTTCPSFNAWLIYKSGVYRIAPMLHCGILIAPACPTQLPVAAGHSRPTTDREFR
jgi:hypothetical protein